MGVFDMGAAAKSEIETNFASHITAVGNEKSKSLPTDFDVYYRERAETFFRDVTEKPGVGIWFQEVRTSRKRQGLRDWRAMLMLDYVLAGDDLTVMAEQVELILEAMMRIVDGLPSGGVTTFSAGDEEFGTIAVHDIWDLIVEAMGAATEIKPRVAGFRLSVPARQRDQIPN
jgi:hypothetical protein